MFRLSIPFLYFFENIFFDEFWCVLLCKFKLAIEKNKLETVMTSAYYDKENRSDAKVFNEFSSYAISQLQSFDNEFSSFTIDLIKQIKS